jgi:hypothetical protein
MAQSADPDPNQTQPAPIVRPYADSNQPYPGYAAGPQITSSQPIAGVLLRVEPGTSVQNISADANGTELRIDHGRANVNVHHPDAKVSILVDLPGGQIALLKDGLYTFNADTNTVRVLKGEAAAYPGATSANSTVKAIKVKEAHQLNFAATQKGVRSVEVNTPRQLTADLLPYSDGNPGGGRYPGRGYGYGPYGDGYYGYGYPGYANGWGYPYGWGYGYPYGLGLGFGYYGGFGGYRGGFGGFRARR